MTPPTNEISPELQAAIQAQLQPGETLLWSGQPVPRELRRQSVGLSLVGLCFTAFAAFWTIATVRQATNYVDPSRAHRIPWDLVGFFFGGLPFLGIGLLMLTTPLWRGRGAIRIAYAVTDRRAISLQGEMLTRRINARVYGTAQMKQLHTVARRDGSADVVFDRVPVQMGKATVLSPIGFFGIADASEVEELIRTRLLLVPSPGTPGGLGLG